MNHRDDLAWCTPTDLPEDVRALSDMRTGRDIRRPGVLDLALAPESGVTRLVRRYQRPPLHVDEPGYLDAGRPDMAFLCLGQRGGLGQGDRHRIDVDCAPGSAVHVTTQAPTTVVAVRDDYATRLVDLRVGAGAVLEYLPEPLVPCRGSRLFQRIRLTAARDSTVILGEILLPGRTARGEAHAYDLYWTQTQAHRAEDGGLLFADSLRLRPGQAADPGSPGVLGEYDVVATLFLVCTHIPAPQLVTLLRDTLTDLTDVLAGATELPGGRGAAVRMLGHTGTAVRAAMRTLWNVGRTALLGVPAPDPRTG
ncbi:MAG TPA: urease accessory protein UreD [Pseudonocardiaceae bacterium]|jgi:urease accessory protein|nr:urease accessory protein UreD [Pseudonocardiaceae bacterium]